MALVSGCAQSQSRNEAELPSGGAVSSGGTEDREAELAPEAELAALQAELDEYEARLRTVRTSPASRPDPAVGTSEVRQIDKRNRDRHVGEDQTKAEKSGGGGRSAHSGGDAADLDGAREPNAKRSSGPKAANKKDARGGGNGASHGQGAKSATPATQPREEALALEEAELEAAPPTRCEQVCDLADAICSIEARVCELAAEHTDDPRYAQTCARAQSDCSEAGDACLQCAP